MMKSKTLTLCSVSLLALCAVGCGEDDETETGTQLPANASEAITNYADIVYASYSDSLEEARALDAAIASFVAAPSQAGLTAARDAWKASREPYLQTEVYRFYEGPIDTTEGEGGPEGLINAWPLDESYIDYVVGGEDDGMVNDPQMTIDKETVTGANEGENETTISTGYHAIEFLLWGQDLSDTGPGARPFTDYVTGEGGTASNQDRRGQYLTTVSELLVENLESLVAAWDPEESGNYRESFLAEPPASALGKIMSGMIILSGFETGGERVQAALDSHDQEDEHSCFSDNTHRDMVQDVQGIQNVWLGSYGSIDGVGIRDVIAAGSTDISGRITSRIDTSLDLANDIQPPFDREIADGNTAGQARVQALADSLFDQREVLEEAFELYGLTRIPDPE
jgi:putative iron-regulated protein